jgi:putative redox protein
MATTINIKNIKKGYQSIISNGKHSILGDEPIKSGGTDLGLAPTELVLAGIAMCKVATVRFIARRKGYAVEDVDAKLEQVVSRGENGKLKTHIKVTIQIQGDITEDQKVELLKQADACYVHRMIEGEWDIESAIDLVPELAEI